ncbi:DUF1269 domain-containing protein [Phytohabitans sp. ZYX-F-186]|uniref:DUF1269 domain-containing protein n=1 Tax=Phytohabitans maris TaxID=3071409 RepID=A0ABU0ZR55_9ACTN|nr:DUF1269 domain-containing protein [Phytohabitans sp. ZYX-F-186]MDQ7909514.1 DUF1269 domain-containing protein [Phytohabitans sp. ZYX-F-186]
MSDLIAVGYPDTRTAEAALAKLADLRKQMLIQLDDAVIVEHRADGKIKLHQTSGTVGTAAAGGALWGGLIGLLFLAPLLGMAIGAGTGALAGKAMDAGIDDDFMRRLGEQLPQGGAALVLLVRSVTADKVLEQMRGQYSGELLQTSLSAEAEAHLKAAITASRPAATSAA